MNKEELNKRIEETENILLNKLKLKNVLTPIKLAEFYEKFIPYLKHGRIDIIAGRTTSTLSNNIDNYILFCKKVGLKDIEIIESIKNFPSIIHTSCNEEFKKKYLLLGLIENDTNTLRKEKLIKKPREYEISFKTLYSRYMLMSELSYGIKWNTLVHSSNNEFAQIFLESEYKKAYKIFKNIDEVNKHLNNYNIDEKFLEYINTLEVNKSINDGSKYGKQ